MHASFLDLAESWGKRALQTILPHYCARCRCITATRGICGTCWDKLTFLGQASCRTCGFPLPVTPESENTVICGACAAHPPPFTRALSVLAYDAESRDLLFRFKHGRDLSLVPLFATWLLQKGAPLWEEADLLLPVPLHWTRLFKRRFNQAAVLAQKMAPQTTLLYHPLLLKRSKRTPPQGHLNADKRIQNVKGAFTVSAKASPLLERARIVLIDDVYTTGATLRACADTLLKAGATSVSALTLARVVRPTVLSP